MLFMYVVTLTRKYMVQIGEVVSIKFKQKGRIRSILNRLVDMKRLIDVEKVKEVDTAKLDCSVVNCFFLRKKQLTKERDVC